jgi:hypothetical protein
MTEIASTALSQGFLGFAFVLLVIGTTIILLKHYLPLISNESKVVALTNSNNELASAMQELSATMITINSENKLETSLIKKDIEYMKKDIECTKEEINSLKEKMK